MAGYTINGAPRAGCPPEVIEQLQEQHNDVTQHALNSVDIITQALHALIRATSCAKPATSHEADTLIQNIHSFIHLLVKRNGALESELKELIDELLRTCSRIRASMGISHRR